MAYTLDFSLALGSSMTGLTLKAQLVDSAGANVGSEVTSGFTEIGVGNYLWSGSIPDGHQGGVVFSDDGTDDILAFSEINPPPEISTEAVEEIEIEPGINLRQALSIIGAALAGVLRLNGEVVTIKGMDSSTTRVTAAVNSNGERITVTLNPPA